MFSLRGSKDHLGSETPPGWDLRRHLVPAATRLVPADSWAEDAGGGWKNSQLQEVHRRRQDQGMNVIGRMASVSFIAVTEGAVSRREISENGAVPCPPAASLRSQPRCYFDQLCCTVLSFPPNPPAIENPPRRMKIEGFQVSGTRHIVVCRRSGVPCVPRCRCCSRFCNVQQTRPKPRIACIHCVLAPEIRRVRPGTCATAGGLLRPLT